MYLKASKAIAQLNRFAGKRKARTIIRLELRAAALQRLRELSGHFNALKLDDREPAQQVNRDIVFGLSAIERCDVQFQKGALEVDCVDGLAFCRPAGQPDSRERTRVCRQIVHEGLDLAMPSNQSEDVIARALHETSAERNIVTDVVNAAHKISKLNRWLIRREMRLLRMLSQRTAALEKAEGHEGRN